MRVSFGAQVRVTLVGGVCVCVCGLETRSRVAVSWLEPNYCVFGRTMRECVARRWCAGDGIMCVTGQYVKEMALFNGLWKAG